MFSGVLIANRGEIAVRIIHACKEMGLRTVAVFSEVDEHALHVRLADEAVPIGPAPALESYLNIEALLAAAGSSGADAVHPGYGFLAENASFARAVEEAGLTWVGPSPEVIELMGDKVAAKALAQRAGVPVVPGYFGEDQTASRMLAEAERIGFPVMLKAAAGGGGKGMRAVDDASELPGALEGAQREARSAFGDDRIFIERLVKRPRHIEIQVFADSHGNVIYLGERDCSIQRRHQKVLEESPSPALTPDLRRAMGRDAVRLARACGYTNAGTIEFLFNDDTYYFLEMNTRIQVEHPVTEAVTGLDLVRLQLEVAAGSSLRIAQDDVVLRGHALEVRVYAEDPLNQFLPSTGRISQFAPPAVPRARNDVGVGVGETVTHYYDPMLAKLIVYGEDRARALAIMRNALDLYRVSGVTTNLDFLRWLIRQHEFVAGRATTAFLDESWRPEPVRDVPVEVLLIAAAGDVLHPTARAATQGERGPWRRIGSWRNVGMDRRFRYTVNGVVHGVAVVHTSEGLEVSIDDGHPIRLRVEDSNHEEVVVEGGSHLPLAVTENASGLDVTWNDRLYHVGRAVLEGRRGQLGRHAGPATSLSAPMPGTVVKIAVSEGQRVKATDPLVVVEAMKMEHVIRAPEDGVVRSILFDVGDIVPAGEEILRLDAE